MNKIIITIITLLIFSTSLFCQEDENKKVSSMDFFIGIRNTTLDMLPYTFRGILTGTIIDNRIAKIPSDYIVEGKKLYTEITYNKSGEIIIKVRNLNKDGADFYEDLFSQYSRFFSLGPLVSGYTDDDIRNKYEAKTVSQNKTNIVLSVNVKSAENKYILYIDKNDYIPVKVESENFQDDYIINVDYQNVTLTDKKYRIPSYFEVIYKMDDVTNHFEINDIKIDQ